MIEIRSVEYTGSLEWTANGMSELSGLMEMCYALTGEFVTWDYVLVKTHPTAHEYGWILLYLNQITLIAQYKLIRDENQSSENNWFWRQSPKAKWGGKECPEAVPFLNLMNLLFLLLA